MSNYKANKSDAVYMPEGKGLTDQSQRDHTDMRIIVTQFLRTGQAPQGKPPIYADFSQLPEDLRGFIEMGRSIKGLSARLPEQLRGIPIPELLAMTTEQINDKLKPAPKEETKEAPKEEKK